MSLSSLPVCKVAKCRQVTVEGANLASKPGERVVHRLKGTGMLECVLNK